MKILIILGHPDPKESFCAALADSYLEGAVSAGKDADLIKLGEMEFDPVLWKGYNKRQELEPDLEIAKDKILEADHLVFVYPNWWGLMPALMKGFFDRVFLPGIAFRYRDDSPFWDQLFKGKTAELLVTMDTPWWYYWLVFRRPGHNAMKRTILGFCGVKVRKISSFSPIRGSSEEKRNKFLAKARKLGGKSV